MPLAPSGKIDRKALPAPSRQRPSLDQAYVAPNSDLEKWLANQWCRVLQLEQVGLHDRFFELGGNSLQAAQLTNELQAQLGETVFIVSLFDQPTIASYAKMLERDYSQALSRLIKTKTSPTKEPTNPILKSKDFQQFSKYIPQLNTTDQTTKTKNKRAIFILAPPRSGTSLLRVMLAGHPGLFAANELQLLGFHQLSDRAKAYEGKFSLWTEGLLRAIMELQACDAATAREMVQEWENMGWTTQQAYQQIQDWLGDQILVDKSPSYVMDPAILQKAESDFEEPFYIHLVRHPYSMIRSFEKMHMDQVMYLHPHPYNARQTGELIWTYSHQLTQHFLQNIPAHRQFRMSYEHLVQAPEQVMRDLCQQIGMDYHPDLIAPYKDITQKMTDGLYADSKPMGDPKLLQHKGIDPSIADQWKGVLEHNFLSAPTWEIAQQLNCPGTTAHPAQEKATGHQDIAIIGISARFAGAENWQSFWQNLLEEKDVSIEFSEDTLLAAGLEAEEFQQDHYVRRGLPLKDHDCFDASFFGYTPKEAALMDPQHRLYLEMAYAALEDAAYDPDRFEGKIGVMG
ncbi:MAG: beta-ketoacyl synthase N-terminal-like domain-containing protein [Bacteroidota bacterium]